MMKTLQILLSVVLLAPCATGDELERLQKELALETEKAALSYASKLKALRLQLTKRGDLKAALKVDEEFEWMKRHFKDWRAIQTKEKPKGKPLGILSDSKKDHPRSYFVGGWACSDGFAINIKEDGHFNRFKRTAKGTSTWHDGWEKGIWTVDVYKGKQTLLIMYTNGKFETYDEGEDGIWNSARSKKTLKTP
jgi:hypothetical protein